MDFDHSLEIITPDITNILTIGGSALELPVGTLGARPDGTATGAIRFNTTTNQLEVVGASTWELLPTSAVGNIAGTASNVTGIITIANGGTGQTTANAALQLLETYGIIGSGRASQITDDPIQDSERPLY